MAAKKDTNGGAEFFSDLFQSNMHMAKLVDAQRRNIEALMDAQKAAFNGYKDAMEKQVGIMREAMDELSTATSEAMSSKTPEANASKQIEMAQAAMRRTFENVREVAELTTKANQDAFAILQDRFKEGLEEMKGSSK